MSVPANPGQDPLQAELDAALEGVDLQSLSPSDEAPTRRRSRPGDPMLQEGTVVGQSGSDFIVELGPRLQGIISADEFDEPPAVGATFEFTLNGQADDGLWNLTRREAKALAAWDELYVGANVEARVTGHNSGGLELRAGQLAAFMPASQIALHRVEDLSSCVDQTWICEVLEVDAGRKRVLLSRRNVLRREQAEAREQAMGHLNPGMVVKGKVTRVEAFGAFVDLGGGLEGLVHVSNMSRKRVENPSEFVEKGKEVEVKILDIKEGGKRIGLGMKQLEPDPWDEAAHKYRQDQIVNAKVVRMMDFGAFMEIEPGLEGLLHISQIDPQNRPRRTQDVLSMDQELAVRVRELDPHARRISLTRLDARGAIIGSEDAVESGLIDDVIRENSGNSAATNLGNLFKKALGGE